MKRAFVGIDCYIRLHSIADLYPRTTISYDDRCSILAEDGPGSIRAIFLYRLISEQGRGLRIQLQWAHIWEQGSSLLLFCCFYNIIAPLTWCSKPFHLSIKSNYPSHEHGLKNELGGNSHSNSIRLWHLHHYLLVSMLYIYIPPSISRMPTTINKTRCLSKNLTKLYKHYE